MSDESESISEISSSPLPSEKKLDLPTDEDRADQILQLKDYAPEKERLAAARNLSRITPEGKQARQELATEIRTTRAESRALWGDEQEINQQLAQVQKQITQDYDALERIDEEIVALNRALSIRSASLIKRTFDKISSGAQDEIISQIQTQAIDLRATQEHKQELHDQYRSLYAALESIKTQKAQLGDTKKLLKDFYTQQEGKISEFQIQEGTRRTEEAYRQMYANFHAEVDQTLENRRIDREIAKLSNVDEATEDENKHSARKFSKLTPEGRLSRQKLANQLRSLRQTGRTPSAESIENVIQQTASDIETNTSALVTTIIEQNTSDSNHTQMKDLLNQFYQDQLQKLNEYQYRQNTKEIESIINSVQHVAEEYDVTFVHAIRPDIKSGWSNDLVGRAHWRDKLDILLSLTPSISTSTIKNGDTDHNMWGNMGVILRRGDIQYAGTTDIQTSPIGLHERIGRTTSSANTSLSLEISRSINSSRPMGYNEMLVDQLQIAGFYIADDKEYFSEEAQNKKFKVQDSNVSYAPLSEIQEMITDLEMPLFVIANGRVHTAEIKQSETGTFFVQKSEKPLTTTQVLQYNYQPSLEQQDAIDSRVRDRYFPVPEAA